MKPLFVLEGKVKRGSQRGKNLGFPTANMNVGQKIPSGIYVSLTTVDGKEYQSLTFIGEAKTFDETVFQAETYFLDFNNDLYDKTLFIKLLKKLRDNEKFTSADELVAQMKKDELEARIFFKLK